MSVDQESHARLLGLLRDVRAEVQNLRTTLMEVLGKELMNDVAMRAREIITTLRARQPIYDRNVKQINVRIRELRSLMNSTASLYSRYGDDITTIENFWERVTLNWPPPPAKEIIPETVGKEAVVINPDEEITMANFILRCAKEAVDDIDDVIYQTALLTIPERLNLQLEQIRIGQALDFHAAFKNEIPNDEGRQKIIEYLGARPVLIQNGVIDASQGVVFHASSSFARRRLSYLFITITIMLGALIAVSVGELGNLLNLTEWITVPGGTPNLLVTYLFIIVGATVHIGIDGIKQARSNDPKQAFLAIDDWFTWIHIHERGIIMGIVSMWIGFLGLVFLTGSADWQTAFLVGYSLDSFVDIFLQRFNTNITSKSSRVKVV
ncbi:MAG: hypothetical protein SH821_09065 [Phototrophicales bacterium]|nr:hypothetical protein [Phototrophicales bacterium]